MQKFYDRMEANKGCDLCGSEQSIGVLWIPDIIKTFFGLERLCIYCQAYINSTQKQLQWPICWGSTSDDEIKWFLIAFSLEKFGDHFVGNRGEFVPYLACCWNGAHARRAPVKPEPYKWPTYEPIDEPVEDIHIEIRRRSDIQQPTVTLKPQFKIRRRAIEVEPK